MRAWFQLKQEMPLSRLADKSMGHLRQEVRLSRCVSQNAAVEGSALSMVADNGKDSAEAAMCLSACQKYSGQLVMIAQTRSKYRPLVT